MSWCRGGGCDDERTTRPPMPPPLPPLATLLACSALMLALLAPKAHGGSCWALSNPSGRCMERLAEDVSRQECCNLNLPGIGPLVAYAAEEMDSGTIFFWRALGGGVPCSACKDSCATVECGEEMKCAMRNGRPKCVCEPKCPKQGRHQRGAVCGTDGRSYRNLCRLRKRACRHRASALLAVAYQGPCQDSCAKVKCLERKQCVVDQNKVPHCVRCSRKCVKTQPRRHVCGVDGHTYHSACHIREAACRKGKAVPVAYKGRCKPGATCKSIRCRERQVCLVDPSSGEPRCATCGLRCRGAEGVEGGLSGPICGSNDVTYRSWCHLMQDACATGYVIETSHPGNCSTPHTAPGHPQGSNSSMSNSLFGEKLTSS